MSGSVKKLFACNGFPTISFTRIEGQWWIPLITLESTIFYPTIRNRNIFKACTVGDEVTPAVSDALTEVYRAKKPKTSAIRCAVTSSGFLALLSSFPVSDAVWRPTPTTTDLKNYIAYARDCFSKKNSKVKVPIARKEEKEEESLKRKKSPPRKSYVEEEEEEEEPEGPSGPQATDYIKIVQDAFNEGPIGNVSANYIKIVQDAFNEQVREEAIIRYMMMPHVEQQAQEILQRQTDEIRERAMALMRAEVDKAVAEHMKQRALELEPEIRETVIRQLSERPDIVDKARNVAVANARAAEKMPLPKRKKVQFDFGNGSEHPAGVLHQDILTAFQREYPQL
jgi:hypothetical protein